MKKVFILCLVALFVATGIAMAETPAFRISPGAGDIIAKHGTMATPDKTFRLVRWMPQAGNADRCSLTKDSIVVWDYISDDGVTVTTSATSCDAAVAGIVPIAILTPDTSASFGQVATADLALRNWGWVQTYGIATAKASITDGAAPVGQSFAVGTVGGNITGYNSSVAACGVGAPAGFCLDAITAGGTNFEVFLRLN